MISLCSIVIIISFQFFQYNGFGQNKITKEGLKIGKWKHIYSNDGKKNISTGNYKIIPINSYDLSASLDQIIQFTEYKNSTGLLHISGYDENNLCVKDSIWNTMNSKGRILRTELWTQGIKNWSKVYDDKGKLSEYAYNDYENDSTVYLIFKQNQLFKKEFYAPENKDMSIKVYYPDNHLSIPNAEIAFSSKFGEEVECAHNLVLSCKQDLSIISISSSSNSLKICFPNISLPYSLTSNDTLSFSIVYSPSILNYKNMDTITIITNEENILPYKIYCSLKAFHIDSKNIETISSITLSKSKDKCLFISSMGSQTDAVIIDHKGNIKRYNIKGITQIDLNKFKIGSYGLQVTSCEVGGNVNLIVIK